MHHTLAGRLVSLQQRLAALASNAWTRSGFEPAAARRIAGVGYWDGRVS
jgi:hypothetical protein